MCTLKVAIRNDIISRVIEFDSNHNHIVQFDQPPVSRHILLAFRLMRNVSSDHYRSKKKNNKLKLKIIASKV